MSGDIGFDLDAPSREALELDAVLAYVASFAGATTARRRLLESVPTASAGALAAEHAAVAEASLHLEKLGRLVPARLPDPEPGLAGLSVEGMQIDPIPLRDLAGALIQSASLKRAVAAIDLPDFPALKALAGRIPDLSKEAGEVAEHIAPDGRIEDGASQQLRRIRTAIATTGQRLRRQLESFVNDPAAASLVRDDFVTQRNGRFVIPVRADSPRAIEGIVHAASSSGATLFVEPIESVALNNELVKLAEREAAEHDRVLSAWTERFRGRIDDVLLATDGLTRADILQAKALFSAAIDGCRPQIAPDSPLRLVDARHPLLDRRLREHGGACVPVSIAIDPYDRVLVISGPNTGGKTVALKTVGLACLMAQCGLPVAAASAAIPPFRQLRADIGDHQSIDADLSTFSAHVRSVARGLHEVDPPALFLFDEIGTGTEPGEGAALGQAVLERLLALRVTGIATTHHAALKAWAFSDPRVASAAMEFDETTLKPTYRVLAGAAGSSAGIAIAGRLGLPAPLIARASELYGRGGLDAEAYMAALRDKTAEAEALLAELRRREEALAAERELLSVRLRDETKKRGDEAKSVLAAALSEFKEQSRRELAEIRDTKERARVERAQVRAEGRLRASVREKQAAIAPTGAAGADVPFVPAAGVKVWILSLDREGEVVSVRRDRIDVRMGSATFTVAREDLAPAGTVTAVAEARPKKVGKLAALAAASRAAGRDKESDEVPAELHLLGQTVDEALPAVDRFLDGSLREARTEVRIVHGHGTGRLRSAVRAHLAGHRHVASFRPGAQGEGGDGATVVTLV